VSRRQERIAFWVTTIIITGMIVLAIYGYWSGGWREFTPN